VPDLTEAGNQLMSEHGLASIPGGQHPGHGTVNRVVPLGDCYLELLTVEGPGGADGSPFGRWAMRRTSPPMRADALVLRTDQLDVVCERLGLTPQAMTRIKPDGTELAWRLAGMDQLIESGLPAFIEWQISEEDLPGRAVVDHDVEVRGINVTLSGDLVQLQSWAKGATSLQLKGGTPDLSATIMTSRSDISV
jgi:hypothetical protein